MLQLESTNIEVGARAAGKEDAIRQVADLLVRSGCIAPGYAESMLAREEVANTYLGKGVAIPHGMPKDRELIQRTGLAVLQVPGGVAWQPGDTARLIVGIAARSDEHLDVLANLTDLLFDDALIARLAVTTDPHEIAAALSAARGEASATGERGGEPADFGRSVEARVAGAHGLHARPATAFVDLAKSFDAEVVVRHGAKTANGKSLAALLRLGVKQDGKVRISAEGPDTEAALAALRRQIEEIEEEEVFLAGPTHGWKPVSARAAGTTVPGLAASPGLAIGPLLLLRQQKIVFERTARDPEREHERLRAAIATARRELQELYQDVKAKSGAASAAIFRAHAEFLADPDLIDRAGRGITEGQSAGWAWQQAIAGEADSLARLDDPLLAGRATDLRDVGTRVLRGLAGVIAEEPELPASPVILLADDLTPSDAAGLDPARVLGFCTAGGGPTSHAAIIARSLGIPAVVGVGPAVLHQPDGATAVLDGDNGILYVDLSADDLRAARAAQGSLADLRDAEYRTRYEPALTTDGVRIEVVANTGLSREAAQAVEAGGEGIGLMRSEFLFLERDSPPSEDEQYAAYREAVAALLGLPLIVRTLDIGGDKEVPYLDLPAEANPFLGVRGIRLCLANPDLFKTQLRAIFRAAAHGPIKIMYPMIATSQDLGAALAITEEVRRELGAERLEVGIMIEVPSAVMMAPELAEQVDFFSIGTNDLTQYVLAMDRGNPGLARQADGLHPAVLRMIDQTVRAAAGKDTWVGVCGGVAGDPLGAVILIGLGVTELSVSIPSIAAIKARVRTVSMQEAQALARRALACTSAEAVRGLVKVRGNAPS
ncbi:MAG TPA: phosphoenolpyruvate--protein phosphotransferase [Thermoanaerobaculia bacterium]|jgi:phosphocarrier protein FPr|nr:phosphoenolpyruvate--protein phosphotransferase [Thermoanaerobaculia bacterium]